MDKVSLPKMIYSTSQLEMIYHVVSELFEFEVAIDESFFLDSKKISFHFFDLPFEIRYLKCDNLPDQVTKNKMILEMIIPNTGAEDFSKKLELFFYKRPAYQLNFEKIFYETPSLLLKKLIWRMGQDLHIHFSFQF